jgi:hypothetical protein
MGPLDVPPEYKQRYYDDRLKEMKLVALDKSVQATYDNKYKTAAEMLAGVISDMNTPGHQRDDSFKRKQRQINGFDAKIGALLLEQGAIARGDTSLKNNRRETVGLNNPSMIDTGKSIVSLISSITKTLVK